MYTEQDYVDIRRQVRQRFLLLGLPALAMLAGVVVLFAVRADWRLTAMLSILLGAYCIFAYGLLIAPVAAYARHLDDVLHARVRTTTGAFKELNEKTVVREGVRYYPVILNVGKMEDPEDDRLFYYDANLPLPPWQPGEVLTVTSHDRALGAWEKA